MDKLYNAMKSHITLDLAQKCAKDVRDTAIRTVDLAPEAIQKAVIFSFAARELIIGAAASLSMSLEGKLSPDQCMEVMSSFIVRSAKKAIVGESGVINTDNMGAVLQKFMSPQVVSDILKSILK